MHLRGLFLNWKGNLIFLWVFVMSIYVAHPAAADENISLVIDGQMVETSPMPKIQNGRTLVPVRLVSETLGAQVDWHQESRTVIITKGNHSIKLRIDNRLFDYKEGDKTFSLSDVPPQIYSNRTYIPLRLVSNALGVSVNWDGTNKIVYIDSDVPAAISPFFDVTVMAVNPGQIINGITELQVGFNGVVPAGASEVRFLLLNPETGRGPVIARGSDVKGVYGWLSDPSYNGFRILATAIYDKKGHFLAGNVVPVELAVTPQVLLSGVATGQVVSDTVSLNVNLNFLAEYVKYEITNQETGNVIVTEESDPQGTYSWTPQFVDNGNIAIRAIAYDRTGQAYYSSPVAFKIDVERKLILKGVSSKAVVEKPTTLWISRNFPINQVEYLLKDPRTGKERILKNSAEYSSCRWFPAPEHAGTWELLARVKDSAGNTYVSNSITVQVPKDPKLLLETVGPNQVFTGTVNLKYIANVPLSRIEYQLINPKTGVKRVIASGSASQAAYSWTPGKNDSGAWQIQAVGSTTSGKKVVSETLPVKVYLGKAYESQPIIEKNKFLDFASTLAKESREKTGMSAALQTAQAILETGWGQYTPVDKYTGQMSYNLFGIKGQGSAGSVTSNTWEEYNGNVFRIDAAFRAYHKPAESWADHKSFLLSKSRYEPFREVMHNSTQGAWALRQTGYATDSKYPLKLINIIKRYDLHLLDEVDI